MAGETIDNALITQFSDSVHVQAQQIRARLRDKVEIKRMTGDVFAYDGLGSVEAREIIARHSNVEFSDIEHNRRKIARRRFAVTLPVDKSDVVAMLTDPKGNYAKACVYAMERVFDRIVVEAMFATVYTGRDFATSVTFATDGGLTVNATAGFTYEKLLEIKQNYIDADVGNDSPERLVLGISGDEHTALMQEIELTSGDYTREFAVERGELVKVCGMELVKFAANAPTPVLNVASTTRDCFAMSTRAICVGISQNMEVLIEKRPDLVQTSQVQIVFELGAVRTEGKLVQKVQTTNS